MSAAGEESPGSGPEAVGEALRNAVEKTLAATAESATETRERAQDLLDDVVRRGQSARNEMTRRGESATARLAEAIGELRAADGASIERLAERLGEVERRLDALDATRKPEPGRRSKTATSPLEPDEEGDLGH